MKGISFFTSIRLIIVLCFSSIIFQSKLSAQSCIPPAVPYITGNGTTTNWRLVSTSTHTFNAAWSELLAATDPNKSYKLVVSGTWGIANGLQHRDAAFDGISLSSPILNQGCDANWNLDNVCHPPIPNSSSIYNANHIYEYILAGLSGGHTISFTDTQYGDNAGALTFTLYVNDGALGFCQGGSATLTSSAAINNQWYKDGVAISSNGTGQTLTVTQPGLYTVKGTNGTNCFSASSNAVSVTVLTANIINNDTTICRGSSIRLSIDSTVLSYSKWQTRLAGKEIYNIKKDLFGNLYAIPSWNSDKIYKSTDRGETWVQLAGFPALNDHNYMALGVDGSNNIYASTNHNGMYRSTDNGTTWNNVQDFGFGCGPMDIVFTSATASVLTVKGYNRGIWYSTNSNSWTQKVGGLDPASITKDIYGNLYASGFYKSTNSGLTWTTLSNAYDGFVVRADSLGNVYTISAPTTSPLYKSSNQGTTFSSVHPLNFSMTNGAYASDILFTKKAMYVAKGQVFYSLDGGINFTQIDTVKYPTANPSGYYSNPTFRMEMLGNRLFVATTDGIKFIDINEQPLKVLWSTGDTTNSIVVTPNSKTTYTVTVTDGIASCQDQVVVNVNYLTGFNPLQDTTTSCGSRSIVLNAGPGYSSYAWSSGAGTQTNTVVLTGKQMVTVTNAQGCQAIDSTFVNLLGINIFNTDSTICRGDSVQLSSYSFSAGQNLISQLNDFSTLTEFESNGQGTTALTNDGISGTALTLNRPAVVRSYKQDYSYGTYEIDAKAADNIANQYLMLFPQSTDINNPNPLITLDARPTNTDDVGWAFWYNGVKVASANGSNPAVYPNWYHIKIRYTPDSLRLWINNTILYDIANPTIVANPVGKVMINTYSLSKYDNFIYTPYTQTKIIRWSTGDTSNNITVKPTQTTTYTVSISNGFATCQKQVTISVVPPPIITANGPTTFCEGGTVQLSSNASTGNQWYKNGQAITSGGTAQQLIINGTGVYSLITNGLNNCINPANNTIAVVVNPLPIANNISASNNKIKIDDQVLLRANPQNGRAPYIYFWTLSDPIRTAITGQKDAYLKGLAKGVYTASYRIRDANNCVSKESANFEVTVLDTKLFFIPTAFSPNNDGLNDVLSVIAKPEVLSLNYFKIFNRYGYLVFETANLKTGWDGRKNGVMQEADSYYWIAEYNIVGGETLKATGQSVLIK